MALIYNGTTVPTNGTIKYNNTNLTKVIYNGTTVWEKASSSWQTNTYLNTGVGNGGGRTITNTKTFDSPVAVYSVYYAQLNNNGKSCTMTTYGSNNNSTWVELAKWTTSASGNKTITITNPTYYKYYKVTQYNNNWRRDDGNDVYSIEPWKLNYYL